MKTMRSFFFCTALCFTLLSAERALSQQLVDPQDINGLDLSAACARDDLDNICLQLEAIRRSLYNTAISQKEMSGNLETSQRRVRASLALLNAQRNDLSAMQEGLQAERVEIESQRAGLDAARRDIELAAEQLEARALELDDREKVMEDLLADARNAAPASLDRGEGAAQVTANQVLQSDVEGDAETRQQLLYKVLQLGDVESDVEPDRRLARSQFREAILAMDEGRISDGVVALRAAARSGHGLSALRLGLIYDPLNTKRNPDITIDTDPVTSVAWYEMARGLGASTAGSQIDAIKDWANVADAVDPDTRRELATLIDRLSSLSDG